MTRRPPRRPRPARRARIGLTLLEVIAASVVLAVALAPALRIVRGALNAADRTDRQERCLALATDRVEFLLARTAADWSTVTNAVEDAAVPVPGYPGLRRSDFTTVAPEYGGIPDRLASVGSLVWSDDDGDGVPDPAEPQAVLASQVAKLTAYEYRAAE